MLSTNEGLRFLGATNGLDLHWSGPIESIAFDETGVKERLLDLDQPCYVVNHSGRIGVTNEGQLYPPHSGELDPLAVLALAPPLSAGQLGERSFRATHGGRYAYATGSMANGIASEELVIALGKERILSSFGAAGLPPARLEAAIQRIQAALPQGPYAFNLIHSPSEDALERGAVELYLKYGVSTLEASAFLDLTPHVVRYRAAGLALTPQNEIEINNKIIAKLSRREVAMKFMEPAPARILRQLVQQGLITELQATLAEKVPLADDITVEADSGGHTDNRPLVSLLPSMLALRDEIQEKYHYPDRLRVGAAGGISTPTAALAAFMMGAAYVVSGSVNQACVEAGASQHTKKLLAEADMADVIMAPAADMFELGVKVQVLKRGSLFPMRAQKLFDLYKAYDSLEAIPLEERERLEKQIFRRSIETVWNDTVAFFTERDPDQIARAANNPKRKMALIFRWYLGLSSRWSNIGEKGREVDYQIWCGPSMGAFNDWVRGSYLAEPDNRKVADIAHHIMAGAAFLYRLQNLQLQGLEVPSRCSRYEPSPLVQPQPTVNRPRPVAVGSAVNSTLPTSAEHLVEPRPVTVQKSTTTIPQGKSVEAIQEWLVTHLAERLAVTPDEVDIREPFSNYGLESAHVLILASELEEWIGCELSPTLLWNYPTIETLAQRLAEESSSAGRLG